MLYVYIHVWGLPILYYYYYIILCTYIIRAIAYNRRRTGTCYCVPSSAARCLFIEGEGGVIGGRKTTHVGGTSLGGGGPARRRTDGRTSPSRVSLARLCAHTSTGPKENRFYYYCYCYCY